MSGFTPRSLTVSLSPAVATFQPTMVGGRSIAGWSLEVGDYAFYTYDAAPLETFSPAKNTDAAPVDVAIRTYNRESEEYVDQFPASFSLKRETRWTSSTPLRGR